MTVSPFFTIVREILKGMALHCGFPEESLDQVFITLDKMDKIGLDGVEAELLELGYDENSVKTYLELMDTVTKDAAGVRMLGEKLADTLPKSVTDNLAYIMDTVTDVAETKFGLVFDPTLVRGMSEPFSRFPWKASVVLWLAADVMIR